MNKSQKFNLVNYNIVLKTILVYYYYCNVNKLFQLAICIELLYRKVLINNRRIFNG